MSFITNLNQQQRKRLHQITLVATFGGLLFGYDTGVINGAFSSLKQYMALTPTTEGLVMSVLLIGAALGILLLSKMPQKLFENIIQVLVVRQRSSFSSNSQSSPARHGGRCRAGPAALPHFSRRSVPALHT